MSKVEDLTEMTFEEFELRFGPEFVEKLREKISFFGEKDWDYQIKVILDSEYFTTIMLGTRSFSYIYEIYKKKLSISAENYISYYECKEALKIMNKLEKSETKKQLAKRELN